MNVLAIEPWYGGSHRQFLDGLMARSEHEWRLASMPARNWRWRMEMGAVYLAGEICRMVESGFVPDVLFVSDMLNLPALQCLAKPCLGDIPAVLYFHENQLTYPLPKGKKRPRAYWQINLLSALAADEVVFNSAFHRNEFLDAASEKVQQFPDFQPVQQIEDLRQRSRVLHVGLELTRLGAATSRSACRRSRASRPLVLLRNQRWEYDKNPGGFFSLVEQLDRDELAFELILTGKGAEADRHSSDWKRFSSRIIHRGYARDYSTYSQLLHQADVVVSTAHHEFFGVAVMEAIYCGCHPLLPNRLSYPELIPQSLHRPLLHAPVLYDDPRHLYAIAKDLLAGEERPLPCKILQDAAAAYNWDHLIGDYDALFTSLAAQ